MAKGWRSLFRGVPLEAILWGGGLTTLYFVSPVSSGSPDLCLVHRIGLGPCPGCGLGAAVHHLLHGDLAASWASHPLGIPALLILAARTVTLLARSAAGGFRSLRAKGAREWQT